MAATPYKPQDVAEVASVRVSIGMSENGTGAAFELDNLAPEAAIGYLTTVVDQLRDEVRERYEEAQYAEIELDEVLIDCPHCGAEIDILGLGDSDDEEDA